MIKIDCIDCVGVDHAMRGMRNPMNSWSKGDTTIEIGLGYVDTLMGTNDHALAMQLAKGGAVHAKYRRMMVVYMDIVAPLYWWKEFDTYKVGTVANSCSTMHKIHAKEFEPFDFSFDHLDFNAFGGVMDTVIAGLNVARDEYLRAKANGDESMAKHCWWQMIQLLPTSYNQKRTVMLNYEVLTNIYHSRKYHKLDEWREFCKMIESLPYSELITGDVNGKAKA